ncbi:Gfo/Idh/MocA family oxidoreductase [Candidatus Nomurabacteria bacterium]|nr:Gfo/Idh/MocA family oxidoreductase [Candidatus Nomurabacteria bacterium]
MNIGIIGMGRRGAVYLKLFNSGNLKDGILYSVCDKDTGTMESNISKYYSGEVKKYTDFTSMLQDENVEGVVICTPDTTHKEIVLECMKYGKNIILEKPIATTIQEGLEIYDAAKNYDKTFCLGFVLRYTDFYRKIKKLTAEGAVGDILTVEANENLDYIHGSSFFRRWHKDKSKNGGLINGKCCHDFDILNWIIGRDPKYVSSFGGMTHFVKMDDFTLDCDDCARSNECIYNYNNIDYGDFLPAEHNCVYNAYKDIVDHQVVTIEYSDYVTASFTLSILSGKSNRSITIYGTKATLKADVVSGSICVSPLASDKEIVYNTARPTDGHLGGDLGLFTDFIRSSSGEINKINDVRSGLYSSLITLGAEISRERREIVNISDISANDKS